MNAPRYVPKSKRVVNFVKKTYGKAKILVKEGKDLSNKYGDSVAKGMFSYGKVNPTIAPKKPKIRFINRNG